MVLISYGIASRLISYITSAAQRVFAYECCEDNRREKMKYKVNFHAEIVIKGMINQKCIITRKKQLMKNNLK